MTRDLARYLDVMATYGAAGEARALDCLGIVRPAGALDVGKGAFAMLGPEVVAKLAAVKTALPPVPGKAAAPTVAKVAPPESSSVAAKLAHSAEVQRSLGQLQPVRPSTGGSGNSPTPTDPNAPLPPGPMSSPQPQSRIDQLLASPWTEAELRELASGPRIVIEPGPGVTLQYAQEMLDCMRYRLRAAMAIRFDSPVPLLGTWTLWDYIKRNIGTIRLWRGTADNSDRSQSAMPSERAVEIQSYPCRPLWSDPGAWGARAVTILIHEGRHLEGVPHNCSNGAVCNDDLARRSGTCPRDYYYPSMNQHDSSLDYGGAYAADYWARRWLAEHSGDWLSPEQRAEAAESARAMLDPQTSRFCDRRNYPGHPATQFDPHPPPPR